MSDERHVIEVELPALHEAMWDCDTPSGCTMLLETDERTELRTTVLL